MEGEYNTKSYPSLGRLVKDENTLFLFLPLTHDTLCFSFKFCKTPYKDRLFLLVHLPMNVFALLFCYLNW